MSGWEIFSGCGDARRGRILAGTEHFKHGPTIRISEDGGATWKGVKRDPKFVQGTKGVKAELKHMGRCVHKLALDPTLPGALVLQFPGGVFRSVGAGGTWTKISSGLPNDFGFPLAVTARDLFVVPLVADPNRVVPDGARKVWRSRNRGRTRRALTKGLPQKDHFVGVLREAMTADELKPAGLYMGTTGGELFYSRDD